jgi:hypothetical protein
MITKSLILLVLLNFFLVVAFVLEYGGHRSLVPLYIGLLPVVLCNFIYAREFIAPEQPAVGSSRTPNAGNTRNWLPLLMMPLCFALRCPH